MDCEDLGRAVRELVRGEGRIAALGSEGDVPKLDWVTGVARLLEHDRLLEGVESEALAIRERGIRHVIWSGMGGSIMAVRVLVDCGLTGDVRIHPLDSTDPAALDEIARRLAEEKQIALTDRLGAETLRRLLSDVLMIGVSMGMTSEEPITHLEWFAGLLEAAGLPAADHILVMTLPDSYLDRFAVERAVPRLPLQPDGGTGTGGRMSAPTTRVFLLPAALCLGRKGELRRVLKDAWKAYDLQTAMDSPSTHRWVRLARTLSDAGAGGAVRLLLRLEDGWQPLLPWLEQLMEESLGKGGKGIVVFPDQPVDGEGLLRVTVTSARAGQESGDGVVLHQPALSGMEPADALAALAASFLGWQLTMSLYGYLQDIPFAGQPAVENYKGRARALRLEEAPLETALRGGRAVSSGGVTMLLPPHRDAEGKSPPAVFASALTDAAMRGRLGYLDLTTNFEAPAEWGALWELAQRVTNDRLSVPLKLRRAPAAYHSTEQSEMDGPGYLVSLRLLLRDHRRSALGTYTGRFLEAQAVATWQAMTEVGRQCYLLVVDGGHAAARLHLERFLSDVVERL